MSKITLQFWIMHGFRDFHRNIISTLIQEFQMMHPEVEVQITGIPWRFAWDKMVMFTRKQQGPDILQIGNTWNGALSYLGVLRDITDYVNQIGGLKIFTPATQRLCGFPKTDRIGSVPWYVDVRAFYYRKDIFDKFGLTTKDLENWVSFDKTCQKINGVEIEGKKVWALGISGRRSSTLVHNIAPWIWGAGGDFLTPDNSQAYFNSPISLRGIEFFFDLLATKGYAPLQTVTQDYDAFINNFAFEGDYAMIYSGPWILTSYLEKESPLYSSIAQQIAAAVIPAGPAGRYTFCGGSNLALGAFSKHPDEAWELLKFFISRPMQEIYTKQTNELPALMECYEPKPSASIGEGEIFKDSVKYGRCFPNSISWGQIELILSDHFVNIFRSIRERKYSLQLLHTELNIAAQKVNEIISKKVI